jgi:PAS domain S-box-containing protein
MTQVNKNNYVGKKRFYFLMSAGIVLLIIINISFYIWESESITREKYRSLAVIAQIKYEQVEAWKNRRFLESSFLANTKKIIKSTQNLLNNTNTIESKLYLQDFLSPNILLGNYENIFITSPEGKVLFTYDSTFNKIDSSTKKLIVEAITEDSAHFADFYYCVVHNAIHLDLIIPLNDFNNNPIAVLVLRINPETYLYSMLKNWPTDSKSAETVLIKREGAYIRVLTKLKGAENIVSKRMISLENKEFVVVKSILGQKGIIEGLDYRNRTVVADIKSIPNTHWYLVTKIDKDEISSEIFNSAAVRVMVSNIIFIMFLVIVFALYKIKQYAVYKNLFVKEKELNDHQAKTKAITDAAQDAIIMMDDEGRISFWNPSAVRILGYEPSEVIGKNLHSILAPSEYHQEQNDAFKTFKLDGRGSAIGKVMEFTAIRKDNKKIFIELSLSSLNNNEKWNAVGIIRDVTLRKISDEKLRESEEKFRKAFLTNPDAININRLNDGMYISVNKGFMQISGYSEAEVIGKTSLELDIWVDKEDRNKLVQALKKDGSISNLDTRFRSKDGTIIDGLMSASIIELNGEPHIISISRDVTERKKIETALTESEHNYNQIINGMEDMVFVIDMNGNFIDVNKSTITTLGYSRAELLSLSPFEIDNSLTKEEIKALIKRMPMDESQSFETIHKTKSGAKVPVEIKSTLINFKGNRVILSIARNITRRKETEEALRKSEERWLFAIEGSDDGVWDWNINNNEVFYSKKWKEMLGYSETEIKNNLNEWEARLHPDDYKLVMYAIQNHLDGKTEQYYSEHRLSCKDGSYKWIMDRGKVLVRNADGSPARMVGTHKDIADKKFAEKILQENEQKYRQLFESLQEGFALHEIILNEEGTPVDYKFLEINKSYEKMTGLLEENVINKTIKEILPSIDNFWINEYGKVALTGKSVKIENFVPELNKFYRVNAYSPGINKFACIIEDITEIKKTETKIKQLSLAVDQSPTTVVITDTKGVIEYVNPKFTELTQYTYEDVIGKNPSVLKSDYSTKEEYKILWDTILAGKEWNGNFLNKKKNGELFWESAKISPLRNSNGEITHFVAIKEDITNKIKSEKELEEYRMNLEKMVETRTKEIDWINKELISEIEKKNQAEILLQESLEKEKELNQLKSRFISTASHEFRTPLTTILSSAELIQRYGKKWEEEKYQDHLERITHSVEYLTNLMDDVLTISRIESGKIIFTPAETNLQELCDKIITDLKLSNQKNHTYIYLYSAKQQIFNLDPKQIQIILQNLLSNASKYSESETTIKLTVDTANSDIQIKVSDEGYGISEEELLHIFEPFHRAVNTQNIEGTGLGLSIVKNAVELHRGTISVKSKLGKGTTFLINIPWNKN